MAAHSRDAAADDGAQIAIAADVDAGGIGSSRGLAHRAQLQAGAALVEEQVHDDGQHHPQIEEDTVAEEDLAHVGDILHGLREGGTDEYGLQVIAHGHEAALTDPHDLANILAHAGAKDGQRQTGDVLVGPEGDGQEAEDQRGDAAGDEGAQQTDEHRQKSTGRFHGLFVVEHTAKADGTAHEHDALHAQIQAAGFLRQHFAQRTEQQRRAVGDGGHHQCDEQIHGIQHDASSLLSV